MGVGKTKLGLMHMKSKFTDYSKFLVVAPKLSIFQSWKDDAEKFGYSYLLDHIEFSTYLSLHKQDNDYDIIYLDECHSLLESHQEFLDQFNGKILGLTGTPPARKSSIKYKMVNKYCPIIFEFSVDEATDSNILNDYKIIIHQLELSKIKNLAKKSKNGGV